ncbi:MAG: divalent cation tolerance protein CutA [Solirubrobacteraceae bacterium]
MSRAAAAIRAEEGELRSPLCLPVVCLVTTPPDQAQAIAEALVERELVACVNIVPLVHSIYRWQAPSSATTRRCSS